MYMTKYIYAGVAFGLLNLSANVWATNQDNLTAMQHNNVSVKIERPEGGTWPVTDRTDWAKEKTKLFREKNSVSVEESHIHFEKLKLERITDKNSLAAQQLSTRLGLQSQSVTVKDGTPTPGGTGYGVNYNDNAFAWTNSTCIYTSYIAPKTPGGDANTFLYNTATNRSNLGVEAHIHYYAQEPIRFMVFDWARIDTNPWVLELGNADLEPYLVSDVNPDGVSRQTLHVVNCTDGANTNWTNNVWLRNFQTGNYDRVYGYSYTTTNAAENTFQGGDGVGWWGPIFETFQDHNGTTKPIGTESSWMLQDGTWTKLSSANSSIRIEDPDLNPPIFQVQNEAWAVGSTAGEFSQPVQQASNIYWGTGLITGTDVIATASNPSNWMLWAPGNTFGVTPRAGQYVAQFDISTPTLGSGDIAWIAVYDSNTGTYIGSKAINLADFHRTNVAQPFRFEFSTTATSTLSVGLYFNSGVGTIKVDKVTLSEI